MPDPVYLDHAATTPLDPDALAVMQACFALEFGNPSSVHRWGQRAEAVLETARAQVAAALGCDPAEVIFTGGGTESDNLALAGVAFARRERDGANHVLTTPVEHEAVLKTAEHLADQHGFELELLPVDSHGRVDPDDLRARLRRDTAVVSVIYGNNEIGTLNPLPQLGAICRQLGIPFHSDAVQAASQLPVQVDELQVDLLSLGAHKFYGPKGVGALYVRKGTPLQPVLRGGSQEAGLRPGTQNVPLIAGMGAALETTSRQREQRARHFRSLRDQVIQQTLSRVPGAQLTGHPIERLPNHASFVISGVESNALLAALDLAGFACSAGSACKTGEPEPSRVLSALGLPRELALGSLRVTVGRSTTAEQTEAFVLALPQAVTRVRSSVAVRQ
jgi:cysteine desulfurase